MLVFTFQKFNVPSCHWPLARIVWTGQGCTEILSIHRKPYGNVANYIYVKLSIEKNVNAHKTLTLRSFYRQFVKNNKRVPEDYYNALKESDLSKREILIEEMLDSYDEGTIARKEAKLIELGSENWPSKTVDKIIKDQVKLSSMYI